MHAHVGLLAVHYALKIFRKAAVNSIDADYERAVDFLWGLGVIPTMIVGCFS
jgi:hypothetical protein